MVGWSEVPLDEATRASVGTFSHPIQQVDSCGVGETRGQAADFQISIELGL